jgi:hypothetical protein
VIAEMTGVAPMANLVRSTRRLLETVARNVRGADHYGSQASVDWDDRYNEDRQDWPDSLK